MNKLNSRLFVFGTLKQGFPNSELNPGTIIQGEFQTVKAYPLYLVGKRFSPWLMDNQGQGFQVIGELYDIDHIGLALLDQLERTDQKDGYQRKTIEVQSLNGKQHQQVYCYLKEDSPTENIDIKLGPLIYYSLQNSTMYQPRIQDSHVNE